MGLKIAGSANLNLSDVSFLKGLAGFRSRIWRKIFNISPLRNFAILIPIRLTNVSIFEASLVYSKASRWKNTQNHTL